MDSGSTYLQSAYHASHRNPITPHCSGLDTGPDHLCPSRESLLAHEPVRRGHAVLDVEDIDQSASNAPGRIFVYRGPPSRCQ